jgi:hypothetical protein
MPFQQDPRLLASHAQHIKHSFVWPVWDYTHAAEAGNDGAEVGAADGVTEGTGGATAVSGAEVSGAAAMAQFRLPEVHAVTADGGGLIYTHRLPHAADGLLWVPLTPEGWLYAPCPREVSLVTRRGIVPRATLQARVRSLEAYARYLEGGEPLVALPW